MKQTINIDARRVVIKNVDKRPPRPSARVERSRDVLDRLPQPVQLRRDRRIARRPSSTELRDVIDSSSTQVAYDVAHSHTHQTSSPPAEETVGAVSSPPARVEERSPVASTSDSAAAVAPHTAAAAPTIYYQDRLVTLYHGDSLAAPELWLHADVLITDPPYGLGGIAGAYGMSHRTIENDLDTTVRDRVLELWGDKPAAVFGTPRLEEPPGGWRDRLVWDKQQLGLNGGAWRYAHETIYVRGEGWHRISDASSSILRHSSQSNRAHVKNHIHSKPEKLLADLIAAAPPGVIVDTFSGGGSTIAAARALGRQIIAFELSEEHCASTVDRLTSRLDLFGGEA
ncbi:hypothetical protein CH252_18930 [Rhodococcus sp. 06-1477-1B]|nr:hypothetical protein CH252_18930 [Rhodococcus sp. 06-1477-1B]